MCEQRAGEVRIERRGFDLEGQTQQKKNLHL